MAAEYVGDDLVEVDLLRDESPQRRHRHRIPRLPNANRFPHRENDCRAWREELARLRDRGGVVV
jgi:hypothetical protein